MLSNLIVTNQKLVLIIDELNRERIAQKFIAQQLHEQGQDENSIKTLLVGTHLKQASSFSTLLNECANNNNNSNNNSADDVGSSSDEPASKIGYNIVLPTLADLLTYQKPAYIFEFLNKLRHAEHVRRIFLWASPQTLHCPYAAYVLAGCEYMADLVLHLETETALTLVVRKPGGSVTNKRYNCKVTKTQFEVTPVTVQAGEASEATSAPAATDESSKSKAAEPSSTFKIELDEEEVVARNALKLPYEHSVQPAEGNIIFTPDTLYNFDEEDPDEDLCI